jgi:hypothetical protein
LFTGTVAFAIVSADKEVGHEVQLVNDESVTEHFDNSPLDSAHVVNAPIHVQLFVVFSA